MRDFPVFTTQNGVASIILREIPYKGEAYITLQNTLNPEELLAECVAFCKIAGAEKIYATGHRVLEKFPLYTKLIKMQQLRDRLPEGIGCLFPVTEQTAEQWRGIYNEKMRSIPTASTMTREDMNEHLRCGDAYFVHNDGQLLGIGIVHGEKINVIASCVPGMGETVLLTLCNALFSEIVQVEVASTNVPAMGLYSRLGFQIIAELSSWHDVTE